MRSHCATSSLNSSGHGPFPLLPPAFLFLLAPLSLSLSLSLLPASPRSSRFCHLDMNHYCVGKTSIEGYNMPFVKEDVTTVRFCGIPSLSQSLRNLQISKKQAKEEREKRHSDTEQASESVSSLWWTSGRQILWNATSRLFDQVQSTHLRCRFCVYLPHKIKSNITMLRYSSFTSFFVRLWLCVCVCVCVCVFVRVVGLY